VRLFFNSTKSCFAASTPFSSDLSPHSKTSCVPLAVPLPFPSLTTDIYTQHTPNLSQDLFSDIRAPPAAPAFPSYPPGAFPTVPLQYANPAQHPGAPTLYPAAASYPGVQAQAPAGFVGASAGFPGFAGLPAGAPAYLSAPSSAFPMANGSLQQGLPQPSGLFPAPGLKAGPPDGAPDPFSTLVPGLKAALPTAAAAPLPFAGAFAPGAPAGFGGGFGAPAQAQAPTNGQIPALHANAAVGFGGGGADGGAGAKSGNPFA
jgi:hypothetical protein